MDDPEFDERRHDRIILLKTVWMDDPGASWSLKMVMTVDEMTKMEKEMFATANISAAVVQRWFRLALASSEMTPARMEAKPPETPGTKPT